MVKLGNCRVTGREQFYTPPDVAVRVIDRLVSLQPKCRDACWIEPAGGTGAFIDIAKCRGVAKVVSFDIDPHHPDVTTGNFLEQHLSIQNAVSVGNPPFGRNNSLSIPFFNHCAAYSDLICFIVPRSWRKWSVTNRLHSYFHLIDDYDLAINYLNVNGMPASNSGSLRTIVQTWERRDLIRGNVVVQERGVIRKAAPKFADVALTVFGFSCGTVKTEFPREPNTTQMFLTLHHPHALEALRSVDFARFSNNTAYVESLSVQEINYLLNEYLFGDPCVAGDEPLAQA